MASILCVTPEHTAIDLKDDAKSILLGADPEMRD
jgi:hypothetical protein